MSSPMNDHNSRSERLLRGNQLVAGLGSQFYGRLVSQAKSMIQRAIKAKRVHHAQIA
jgi:hypothetical protein